MLHFAEKSFPNHFRSIDKRVVVDAAEQYAKPIDIPPTRSRQRKFLSMGDMGCEKLRGAGDSETEAHIATFHTQTEKVSGLINKLFS